MRLLFNRDTAQLFDLPRVLTASGSTLFDVSALFGAGSGTLSPIHFRAADHMPPRSGSFKRQNVAEPGFSGFLPDRAGATKGMFRTLRDEIDGIMSRDPAARTRLEVILNYPSLHALLFYRAARWFWRRKMHLIGRWISQWGRFWTGIEIHPGATIGRRLFIDHGMGVVIGETAEIGDDVTLYHDVTLGGTSPSIASDAQRNVKRHPTLQDGVIVGSGAQILGPITVGANARVGANAVVVRDIEPNVTVTGIPAKTIMPKDKRTVKQFVAYGTTGDLSDPLLPAIEGLRHQVQVLTERIEELEAERDDREEPPQAKSA